MGGRANLALVEQANTTRLRLVCLTRVVHQLIRQFFALEAFCTVTSRIPTNRGRETSMRVSTMRLFCGVIAVLGVLSLFSMSTVEISAAPRGGGSSFR
jgi:hypothetical protein